MSTGVKITSIGLANSCQVISRLMSSSQRRSPSDQIEVEPLILDDPECQQISHWSFQMPSHVGLLMAVFSSFCFSLCSLIVKLLDTVSPLELALFRFMGIFLPSLPLAIWQMDPVFPKEHRLMLVLRSIIGTSSLVLQFYAFRHMPLADASVIIFSVPIFVAIFARIFLKEPCGLFNVLVTCLTIIGVVLIARPPFFFGSFADIYTTENWWGVGAACAGTIVAANVYVILRILKGIHFSVIMTNFSTCGILITAMLAWTAGPMCLPRCGKDRYLVVAIGFFSFGGQILLTKALQLEQAGPVSIARTSDIVFAFIWQIAVFGDLPDAISISGAIFVVISVLLTGLRKWLLTLPVKSQLRQRFRYITW